MSNGLISSASAEKEPAAREEKQLQSPEPGFLCIMPRDPQWGGGGTLEDMSAQSEPLCMWLSLFN